MNQPNNLSFENFKEQYEPRLNPYYSNFLEGYGFKPIDFNMIMDNLQPRLIWSIMQETIWIDQMEHRTITKRFAVPGKQPLAIGYFITSVPFQNPNLLVVLP